MIIHFLGTFWELEIGFLRKVEISRKHVSGQKLCYLRVIQKVVMDPIKFWPHTQNSHSTVPFKSIQQAVTCDTTAEILNSASSRICFDILFFSAGGIL